MAARSAWSGSITFGGFPIPVVAYSLLESASAQSFSNVCKCHHQKVVAPKRCPVDDVPLAPDQMVSAASQGRGKNATLHVLPEDAIAALKATERTTSLEILRLPQIEGVPWHLATGRYALVPDDSVAGAEGPVGILWNGLNASNRALISEWVKRAGSAPTLVAIRADIYGLTAVDLPYYTSLKTDVPAFKPEVNEQAAAMFEQFAQVQGISMDDFTHTAFANTYRENRDALIAKALAGEKIEPQEVAPAAAPAADMMAMMAAALDAAKPTTKAKKPAAKRTKAAK